MELPYHMKRRPPGEKPQRRYTGPDVQQGVQALGQAAADTSVVVDWLREQPGVDPNRIGAVGASLGAVVSHLAMGKDERLSAGVALLGGGDLPYLRHRSILFNFPRRAGHLNAEERVLVKEVDPLTYADRNRPRHVLMVQAARDLVVPPRCGRELWKALGRPPIRWLDTGHSGPLLAQGSAMRATATYLHSVWGEESGQAAQAPKVYAPTIKAGTIFGLDSIVTPALTWQAYSLRQRRDQMSLVHADLGWSGRGPFLGLAATLNAYLDLGVGHRLRGAPIRPYASVHVAF
jgi:hypothetical protein